jgi:cytochrome P450
MRITRPRATDRMPLQDIDLYDPGTFTDGDPHLAWQTLRNEAPVCWQQLDDGRGFWSVTKYDDCCWVLSDHTSFTSARGAILKMLGTDDPAGGAQMAVSDPPRHTHVRRPLQQMLTPQALAPSVPRIEEAIRTLLAPLDDHDTWDIGAAMCALPMLVSGVLMGLPEESYPELIRLGLMTVAPDDKEFQVDDSPAETLRQAHIDLFAYFADEVRRRRRKLRPDDPPRDLIDRLMTMRVEGTPLTDGEIVSNCYSLLLGANVNTGHVVSVALLALADDLDQYHRWASDDASLRSGIREAMRWSSPVVHFLRYATHDVEIRGRKIAAGDGVVAWIPSANRDEEVFQRPFEFDIDRAPNREIAFGYGPHRCIGSTAAQISLRITLQEIFARVAEFEVAGEVSHLCSNFTGGITHLPLRITRRVRPRDRDRHLLGKAYS